MIPPRLACLRLEISYDLATSLTDSYPWFLLFFLCLLCTLVSELSNPVAIWILTCSNGPITLVDTPLILYWRDLTELGFWFLFVPGLRMNFSVV